MDVRLPDGTILRNVPEGTTKAQIAAKLGMAEMPAQDVTDEINASQEPKKTAGQAALTGALQGATFGLADEAIARVGSLSPDLTYDDIMAAAREDLQRTRKDQPVASIAGEIVGGLATGLTGGLTKAGTAIASSLGRGNIGSRIAKAASLGAASGGIYGAGTADQGDRIEGAKSGAILGGTIGGAIPAAAGAIKSVAGGTGRIYRGFNARDTEELQAAADLIKNRASKAYQAVRDSGATFKPGTTNLIIDTMQEKLKSDGVLNPRLHDKVIGLFNDFKNQAIDENITLEGLDQWRQLFGQVAGEFTDKVNARKAGLLKEALDEAMLGLPDEAFSVGGKDAISALRNARQEWARQSKFNAVSDIVEASAGDANKLKRDLEKFRLNPKKTRGWSKEEVDALKAAAGQTTGEGLMKALGKFGFDLGSGRGVGNTALPVIGGIGAGIGSGTGVGVAVPVIGTGARVAQKMMARESVENLLKVIEQGGKVTGKQISNLPEQDQKKLMSVMLQGVTIPSQSVKIKPEKPK